MGHKRWEVQCSKCDQRVGVGIYKKESYPHSRCSNMMNTYTDDGCGIYSWHMLGIMKCPVCGGDLSARVRGTRGCKSCNWTFTTLHKEK